FSDNGTGSYGNDSDNNKYIALIYTNTLLKHNKILVKNELFDNVGEFLNYLQQKNATEPMNFILYINTSAYYLKRAMFFIPEDKKEEFKKLLPWLLPEEESAVLYPVHFDNYYFKSHSEACSFLNGLKREDIRLSDTKESCEKQVRKTGSHG
ncbi:MAG: hypothetical protein II944_08425, partial [Ruminobacter sp.]|nr:hypothetical protein [Ruminobacter sp.]